MKKRVLFLITFVFLLLALSFFLEFLNKNNIITALVTQDLDFNSIEQLSTVNKEGETINFIYNEKNYSFRIEVVLVSSIAASIGQDRYNINARETRNIDLDRDGQSDISVTLDNLVQDEAAITLKRISCIPDWYCGYFGNCRNGIETRQCTDLNRCTSPAFKPDLSRPCIESCSDGVKNQDESDIDCGGTKCKPCSLTLSSIYFWTSIPIILAFISVFIAIIVMHLKKRHKHHDMGSADAASESEPAKPAKQPILKSGTINTEKKAMTTTTPTIQQQPSIPVQQRILKEVLNESLQVMKLRKYIELALGGNFPVP